RPGVALAARALRVAVGLGDDDLALPVGVGADLLRLGGAGGAQLVGDALALRFHAAVDRLAHVLRQVDALQAYIDDLDADALQVLVDLLPHARHDVVALAGDDIVQDARAKFIAQNTSHGLLDPPRRLELVAADADVVLLDVDDAPLDERVDQH